MSGLSVGCEGGAGDGRGSVGCECDVIGTGCNTGGLFGGQKVSGEAKGRTHLQMRTGFGYRGLQEASDTYGYDWL